MKNENLKREKTNKEDKKREKIIKVLSFFATILSVLAISVAFAAVSKDIIIPVIKDQINGDSDNIIENIKDKIDHNCHNHGNSGTWLIYFDNLSDAKIEGDATTTKPTLSRNYIMNYNANVTKPGDSVEYQFDIVNEGTLDAKIEDIVIPTNYNICFVKKVNSYNCMLLDFDNDGVLTSKDSDLYNDMIDFNMYYVKDNKKVKPGDELLAKSRKRIKLVLNYKEESTFLPKNSFKIIDANSSIKINFVQLIKR